MGEGGDRRPEAWSSFEDAVRKGEVETALDVLEREPVLRAHLDDPAFDFDTPALVFAAGARDLAMVEALVEAGADIDARSSWANGPYSALHHAAGGSGAPIPELAELLLRLGATVDLHSAAGLGDLERLGELLDAAPERISEPGPDGATPLHLAATPDVARFLLARGAPIDRPCIDHLSTPAMWAVDGRRDVAAYLVDRGARPDIWMLAAIGDVEGAKALLASDPDAITVRPGDEALGGGNIYVWRLHFASSPLEVARRDGRQDLWDLLWKAAPPGMRLLEAAKRDDDVLLGAQLEAIDWRALDPEYVREALCVSAKTAARLIEAGAEAGSLNRSGQTALHHAAWHGDLELGRVLVEGGAPIAIRDGEHHSTPWGWADYGGQREMADWLLTLGEIDLFDAIALGRIDDVRAWLEGRPEDARESDDGVWSPLRTAAWHGHVEIARLLLDFGADPRVRNPTTGLDAVELARQVGHTAVVALLEA